MARKPAVTRTITTTRVNALCVDIPNSKAIEKEFMLPRTYRTRAQMLKKLNSLYDTEDLRVVNVITYDVIKTMYGMTEDEFIKLAKPITDRNKLI